MSAAKYLFVIGIISIMFGAISCKSSMQSVVTQDDPEVIVTSLKDDIIGEWRLLGLDENIEGISQAEKEAYEQYMEELFDNFLLTFYGDGRYQKALPDNVENGRWRLVDGDSGITLYPENGTEQRFDIREYNNPLLRLVETKEGEKRVLHLRRADY